MNTIPNGGPPVPKKARLSEPAASNTNNFAFNTKHDNSTLKSLLSGSHSNGMTEGATKKSQKKHSKKKNPLHSGRWTPEEEAYVEGMIAEFTAGLLPIAEGTTLRSFLAKMLNCNPKRVSKKYDGNKIYNGKSAFSRARTPLPPALACERQEHLLELERKFREALSTMQRVESRLQSLTATGAYAAGTKRPPVVESLPSNSAVSSLTASGDEAEGGATATAATSTASKSEQCSFQVGTVPPSGETSVAQVSQCMDAPSLEALKEPEPAAGNSYDDAAMLLQLRTPTVSTANASAITQLSSSNQPQQDANSRDTSFNGDLILQDLHKSQARDEAAAASAPKQNNTGGDATTLQHILQSLQQPQQVTPAAPANNSDLLALAGMFAQQQPKSSSPIQAPKATQNSLQDLLLSLQKNNGFSGTANGASITENLLKQLSSTKSVNQEQQKQMPPPLDFQSALMALQQQQQQQQQQPMVSPKTDIERLVEQIMNSNSNGRPQQTHSQQAPTSVSLAPNSADTLSSIFQQTAQSVPKHATAPSAAATWQNNSWDDVIQALTHLCRQGQADTNHFPVHQSPQQQQQQQQQQQASLENVMSSVINQMQTSQQQQQQYMVQPQQQQQQQQQQPQGLGAPALQSLMQSIGASVQQQQEAPKPSTVEETLQKWLVSIQQQH